jgi:hypothetical protein
VNTKQKLKIKLYKFHLFITAVHAYIKCFYWVFKVRVRQARKLLKWSILTWDSKVQNPAISETRNLGNSEARKLGSPFSAIVVNSWVFTVRVRQARKLLKWSILILGTRKLGILQSRNLGNSKSRKLGSLETRNLGSSEARKSLLGHRT